MRYKPRFLPQVSAPYTIVLQQLDNEGVTYNVEKVDPNLLNVSQGVTLSDEVGECELSDDNPIWVANDDKVIDGHHRLVKAIVSNEPIMIVRVLLDYKDACRVLNKIQDIFEYEQMRGLEETTNNEVINDENGNNYDDDSEFLSSLEENNSQIQNENPAKNEKMIIAYRKEPIKENSVVGNFFLLEPIEGFSKYQIDFDNLLDTNELGIAYKDSQNPIDILAKIWFPHVNFEKIGTQVILM
jgi:hypothetical protein